MRDKRSVLMTFTMSATEAIMLEMRELWRDHVEWTRHAIISTVHNLPDAEEVEKRLLRNQADIGHLFRRFYGDSVADRLTGLLTEHIRIASDLVVAAKADDHEAVARSWSAWVSNADEIAALWAEVNPKWWPLDDMKQHMHDHLSLTLDEARARISGDYVGDVARYDEVVDQVAAMADVLSRGIINR